MPVNNRQPSMARPNTVNRQPQVPPVPQRGPQVPPNVRAPQNQQAPRARQQQNTRPEPPAPAHAAEMAKRPSSKLILVIIALVLSLIGAVLVAVGVFVLKDPKPKQTVLPPANNYQAPAETPAPTDVPLAGNGEDAQPGTTDEQAPAEDGSAPEEAGTDGEPDGADDGAAESTPEQNASDAPAESGEGAAEDGAANDGTEFEAGASRLPGEALFVPLVSITTGGDTIEGAEPPATAGAEGEDPAGAAGALKTEVPVVTGEDDVTTAPEGDAAAGDAQGAEPTEEPAEPAPTQAPAVEPTPAAGPAIAPVTEEEESGFGAKQIVTLIGAIMVGIGSVLALVAGFLQHAAIASMGRQMDALQNKVRQYEDEHRDPTFAEKLKYAFEQIPTLTLEEARARTEARTAPAAPAAPAGAYRPQVPDVPPQPVVSPAEQADAGYNRLLTQGGQMATQTMINDGTYTGAGIDISGCLYAYQSGQNTPYHVVSAGKGWGVQYFVVGADSTAPQLYPNPYSLEQSGLANAQNMQYILNAFNVTVNGTAVTPQSIGMASSGLQIRRVVGARMDAQNVVIQKGQIEMG